MASSLSILSSNADLVMKWAFLESGIDLIMTKWDPSSISYTKYMAFYTVAFNYCEGSSDVISADIPQSKSPECAKEDEPS
jgi:hypothetical protein